MYTYRPKGLSDIIPNLALLIRFMTKEEALRAIKAFNGVSIRNFIMLNWLDFVIVIGSQILVKSIIRRGVKWQLVLIFYLNQWKVS